MKAGVLRFHVPAIAFALVVACIMTYATLAFRVWAGSAYRGVDMTLSPVTQDAAWYHAVVKEAMEGGKPWNAILAEGKENAYPVPDLAERIMALPGRVLPVSVQELLIVWRIVLVALTTLAVYAAGFVLTRSRAFGIFGAGVVMFWGWIVVMPELALGVFSGRELPLFTLFDRPVHPQFEVAFLWMFLVLAALALRRPIPSFWIPAGIILGLLMHAYVWAWTWGSAVIAVLVALAIVLRSWSAVRALCSAAGLALLIGFWPVWKLVSALRTPIDPAYGERLALFQGHLPASWAMSLPVILAALLTWAVRRRLTPDVAAFLTAGLAATLIALNQQLITGVSLQPDHYIALIGGPLVVWAFAWTGWSFLAHRSPAVVRMSVGTFVVLCGTFLTLAFSHRSFVQHREQALVLQPFAGVADWLNANTDRKSVVFAHPGIALLVPIHTDANAWWSAYAMAVPVSDARIEHAAFTWFALNGIDTATLRGAMRIDPVGFAQHFTLSTLAEQRIDLVRRREDEWLKAYDAFRSRFTPAEALRAYRVDFILYDKAADRWKPADLEVGDAVFENERFVLYRAN